MKDAHFRNPREGFATGKTSGNAVERKEEL